MGDSTEQGWTTRAVVGLALLAAALRLLGLGSENFWIDEVYQLQRAARSPDLFLGGYFTLDPSRADPTPVSLLIHHLIGSWTSSEWVLRLPSAIFATAEVLVTFVLARWLVGGRVALLASGLLAVNPLHVWYAQETRWYALWTLLSTISFVWLVGGWRGKGRGHWAAYALTHMVGVYTFVFTFLVMAVQGLAGLWLTVRKQAPRSFFRSLVLAQAAVFLVALPQLWLVTQSVGEGGTGTPRPFQPGAIPYALFVFSAGFSAGPTLGELHDFPPLAQVLTDHPEVLVYALVFGGLAVRGAIRLAREVPAGAIVLGWLIGLPAAMAIVDLLTGIVFNPRYILPTLVAWVLTVACGLAALWSDLRERMSWVRWAAAGGVALCTGYSLFNYYWVPRYDKEDVRGALAAVQASPVDGDVAVVGQVFSAAVHYRSGLSILGLTECRAGLLSGANGGAPIVIERYGSRWTTPVDTLAPTRLREASELWLLVSRDWDDEAEACLSWLEGSHAVAERREFTGVDLYLLENRTSSP